MPYALELLTPLKIKEQDALYYKGLLFKTFFKFLVNRIINLSRLYSSGMDIDKDKIEKGKRYLLSLAESVKMEPHTIWDDPMRYSSRQEKWMKMGGQLGLFLLSGDMIPFYPYLMLGEHISVGLHTTSGFGRYTIRNVSPPEKGDVKALV